MENFESILKRNDVQAAGKISVILSIVGGIANYITQMEIINPVLVTVSSILGIAFLWYKLKMIHLDYVERKEFRKQKKLPEVKFRWKFWKLWRKRKKK